MGIDFSLHRSKPRPLLFNFALGYLIRKVRADHKELEWDGTLIIIIYWVKAYIVRRGTKALY